VITILLLVGFVGLATLAMWVLGANLDDLPDEDRLSRDAWREYQAEENGEPFDGC